MATVIASQATISGTLSMTQQDIALGFLPRMRVLYTSDREIGQIYIPAVNWLQCMVVILAVVGFGSSTNLAAAYGIAVTVTMLMTTILTFFVIRYKWRYNLLLCWGATGFFLTIDFAFFRSEEHTSELQSVMRTSYGLFVWQKQKEKHLSHLQSQQ